MIDNQPKGDNRIFGLDLVRAMAILMVLSSSLFYIYPNSNGIFSQLVALSGFLGIEIFFVLSGFLLGGMFYQLFVDEEMSTNKIIQFIKRGCVLVMPSYFLILVINTVIALFIGKSIEQLWKYFFFLQNFSVPMPDFFSESWVLPIVGFASLIALLGLFLLYQIFEIKNKSRFFLILILMLIFLFFLARYYYCYTTSNTTLEQWDNSLKAVVIYRLDSVFIGFLLSWFYRSFGFMWNKFRYLLAGIGFLTFVFLFTGVGFFRISIEKYPLFWNVFYLPITSIALALFVPLLVNLKVQESVIKKPIVFLSKIGYSVYLIYGMLLQFLLFVFDTSLFTLLQLYVFTIAYWLLTIVLGWVLYFYFEKPIFKMSN